VLEACRQIALMDPKPKRTVRIVFFANEENGLAGAATYAKAHEAEVGKHMIALEAEIGASRVVEARYSGNEGIRAQFPGVAALVKPLRIAISSAPPRVTPTSARSRRSGCR
jgi:Zn-dependent M28 family amino/carboxypeptidase